MPALKIVLCKGKSVMRVLSVMMLFGVLVGLSGCGAKPPPEFSGRWKPVNRFAAETQAIPLVGAYTFYAAPVDGTLKGLLTRWAEDAKLGLSYQLPNDYTLHKPVSALRATTAEQAAAELNAIYTSQGVEVLLEGATFVVRQRSGSEAP